MTLDGVREFYALHAHELESAILKHARATFDDCDAFHDTNTSALVLAFPTFEITCSPGWEDDWEVLPVEITRDDGEPIYDLIEVAFHANIDRDVALYFEKLAPFIQECRDLS